MGTFKPFFNQETLQIDLHGKSISLAKACVPLSLANALEIVDLKSIFIFLENAFLPLLDDPEERLKAVLDGNDLSMAAQFAKHAGAKVFLSEDFSMSEIQKALPDWQALLVAGFRGNGSEPWMQLGHCVALKKEEARAHETLATLFDSQKNEPISIRFSNEIFSGECQCLALSSIKN